MTELERKTAPIQRVAILLINFNLPAMTDRLVEQIKRSTYFPYELFVLDNGSEIDKRSRYSTHILEKNVGLTGGIEYLWSLVKERREFDAFWWLCNDIILDENRDYLHEMVRVYTTESTKFPVACITPSYHWRNKEESIMAPGNMRSILRATSTARPAVYIEWNALFITRDFMDSFFHEGFGLTTKHAFHDALISYTSWKNGYQTLIIDSLSIVHIGNRSFIENGGQVVNGVHIPNIKGLHEMLTNDMKIFADKFKEHGIDVIKERDLMHENVDLLHKFDRYLVEHKHPKRNMIDWIKIIGLKVKSKYA